MLSLFRVLGEWDQELRRFHINILALQAVFKTLHHFKTAVREQAVRIRSNTTTVVSYTNYQGGTQSAQLCPLTWQVYHFAIEKEVNLQAVHIPGNKNVLYW